MIGLFFVLDSNFLEFVASQHVFVVGIFGKTGNVKAFPSRETSKAGLLDHALQKDVFWIHSDSNDRNEQVKQKKAFAHGSKHNQPFFSLL